jgi:hypothetical protein
MISLGKRFLSTIKTSQFSKNLLGPHKPSPIRTFILQKTKEAELTDEEFWTIENLKSHDTYQKFSVLMKKIVKKGGVPDKQLLNIFQIQARRIVFSSEKKYLGVEDYTL